MTIVIGLLILCEPFALKEGEGIVRVETWPGVCMWNGAAQFCCVMKAKASAAMAPSPLRHRVSEFGREPRLISPIVTYSNDIVWMRLTK